MHAAFIGPLASLCYYWPISVRSKCSNFDIFEVCEEYSSKMTLHAALKTTEEKVDKDEQVLFGDITAEVEEPLVDVEVVPEHTVELRKELDNMNTGKDF